MDHWEDWQREILGLALMLNTPTLCSGCLWWREVCHLAELTGQAL